MEGSERTTTRINHLSSSTKSKQKKTKQKQKRYSLMIESFLPNNTSNRFNFIMTLTREKNLWPPSQKWIDDSSTLSYNSNLKISGYTLVRSDDPSNNKRGGVCIYYKSLLPLRILNIQYLQESIYFELKIGDKTCSFLCLYRSPSQSQDDFETFTENLELNVENLVQGIRS